MSIMEKLEEAIKNLPIYEVKGVVSEAGYDVIVKAIEGKKVLDLVVAFKKDYDSKVHVSRKKLEEVKELKGNELGWILKLAENHYDSKQFREYIKKNNLGKLDNFLKLLMCKFHPNNFYPEHEETTWILIKKSELFGDEK